MLWLSHVLLRLANINPFTMGLSDRVLWANIYFQILLLLMTVYCMVEDLIEYNKAKALF